MRIYYDTLPPKDRQHTIVKVRPNSPLIDTLTKMGVTEVYIFTNALGVTCAAWDSALSGKDLTNTETCL